MKEESVRVNDLISWRHTHGSEPSLRGEHDPVAALQNDANRAFDDYALCFDGGTTIDERVTACDGTDQGTNFA
jgi:hypothetical protein